MGFSLAFPVTCRMKWSRHSCLEEETLTLYDEGFGDDGRLLVFPGELHVWKKNTMKVISRLFGLWVNKHNHPSSTVMRRDDSCEMCFISSATTFRETEPFKCPRRRARGKDTNSSFSRRHRRTKWKRLNVWRLLENKVQPAGRHSLGLAPGWNGSVIN